MSTDALQTHQEGNPDFAFGNGKARREERKKSRQNRTKENSDGNGQ